MPTEPASRTGRTAAFRWIAVFLVLFLLLAAAPVLLEDQGGTPHDDGFFQDLLRVYMPRRQCMFNEAPVIWLHVVSDILITIAYFSIPVALIVFVRRRTDLAFNWMFRMFAMFIFACGMTHLVAVWDIWHPLYKIEGLLKLYTGLISVATALLLWRLIPMAVALPTASSLRAANAELARVKDDLEVRVQARTRELAEAGERERSARTEAERANRTKDEFLAILSHELRTPLSAILGWAHLLARTNLDEEDRRRGVEVIERNARVQGQLIEDLLDMSRVTAGKVRLDMQPVDLARVIDDAIETVQSAMTAKDIRLERVLDPQAGPVRGDPDRLRQVVWNLLSNAVKFTDKGGRVSVLLERIDSHVEITVADTGQGIRPETLPHLFERFRQEDSSTTRRHSGLGLGLAIVRSLVELHGGSVRAESEGPGKGSRFRVMLPLSPLQAPQSEKRLDGHPATSTTHAEGPVADAELLRGVRVLVVDDEWDAGELVRILLERAGAEVTTAASAREALDALSRMKPDILVSDIGMPEEDGISLIRKVRALPDSGGGKVPALALTAFARPDDRRQTLMNGFQIHLAKPVDPTELTSAVASLAGRTRRT
jgi:signal transduction histidine kinase/ActR/RegA family two-component response regulator